MHWQKIDHMLLSQHGIRGRGPIVQSVACPTADPGVASLILDRSHIVMDHKIPGYETAIDLLIIVSQ